MHSSKSVRPDLFSEIPSAPSHLQVVRASFQESVPFDWNLLQEFDSLRVLTYTASLRTVVRILAHDYKDFECIFGCERVLGQVRDVVGLQHHVQTETQSAIIALPNKNHKPVLEAITAGRARFRVVNGNIAHTKLYLLESAEGVHGVHRRVLMGSANLSEQALGGGQHEALTLFEDDDAAWQHYSDIYNNLRERSTYELPLREVRWDRKPDWSEVPILNEPKTSYIAVESAKPDTEIEPQPSAQIETLERVAASLPDGLDTEAPPIKGGCIALPPVVKTKLRHVKVVRDPDQTDHSSFRLDVNTRRAWLDDEPYSLDGDREAAVREAGILRDYFAGFEEFSGNVRRLQQQYFILWAWYWFSPLLCDLRTRAQRADGDIFQLPLYAIVFGASNCGKTSLVNTLSTAMFGRPLAVDKAHFTRSKVRALQGSWGRLPIVFDDLGKKAFNDHGKELIKNELIRPASEHPGLLLSMNADQKAYPDEIVKRCLMIYTTASLPQHREELRQRLHVRVAKTRSKLTTNLYRLWLSAVLDQLAEDPSPSDWLRLATGTLAEMVAEGANSIPAWCRSMEWGADYADHRYDQVRRRLQEYLHPDLYTTQDRLGESGWTLLDRERLAVWESNDMFGRSDFNWEDVPSSLIDHDVSGKRRRVLFRTEVEDFLGDALIVPGQVPTRWWTRILRRN